MLKTGERLWTYRGPNIMHVTITIGDGRMFFVESTLSQEEREALLQQDKTALKDLPPEEAKKKEEELKRLDVRTAVALDAKTGEEVWRKAIDVTNCTNVSAGGGNLALMYKRRPPADLRRERQRALLEAVSGGRFQPAAAGGARRGQAARIPRTLPTAATRGWPGGCTGGFRR